MQNVRIDELLDYVRNGRIMDAMREFYADDVVMSEPEHTTEGLESNIEREQEFVDSVAEFKNFEVVSLAKGDDVSIYENVMDWVTKDGESMHVEQVSVAKWKNGKIVSERFYYAT